MDQRITQQYFAEGAEVDFTLFRDCAVQVDDFEREEMRAQIALLTQQIAELQAINLQLSQSAEDLGDETTESLYHRIYRMQHPEHEGHEVLDLDNIAQTPVNPIYDLKYKILDRIEKEPSRCLFKSRNSDLSHSGGSKY